MMTTTRTLAIATAVGMLAAASPAAGQVAPCSQAQPAVNALIDGALARVEAARQTNDPAALRDAADDLQAALLDLRARLAPCAAMPEGAAADPHAGHSAVQPPQGPAPAAPPPTGPAGSAASRLPAPATSLADLKCRTKVEPRTAPRMLYQGRMYYFCSEQERAAFAKDPGKYATAPAERAPAHAH